MKQKIDPKDIRKGDKIRVEGGEETDDFTAMEYVAQHDEHSLTSYWNTYKLEGYYLLERPEPPFEPYWGMVIGDPDHYDLRAVYIPGSPEDFLPWLGDFGDAGRWSDTWAKQRLAEGWVVIEKPEGVK